MADALRRTVCAIQARFTGTVGVFARRLPDGETVAVRATQSFETASAIKPLILAAAFDLVRRGLAQLDEPLIYERRHFVLGSGVLRELAPGLTLPLHDVLTLMIALSDNIATNMTIDRVGGVAAVNAGAARLGLLHTRLLARLNFESGDNDAGFGRATPADLGRFYELLYHGRCVGPAEDAAMRDILMRQQYNTLLTRALPYALICPPHTRGTQPALRIASKSGAWEGVRCDAGIFYGPAGDYVLAVMSEGCRDHRFHVDNEALTVLPAISRAAWDAWGGDVADG